MEQLLEVVEDRTEAGDELLVVELAADLLGQVGGGTGGTILD